MSTINDQFEKLGLSTTII